MARLIPGLNSSATTGERRFAQRLESLLEDDYLCWCNVPLGRRHRHPDFIILHPRRGLLVIEVKDWKLETIRAITRTSVTELVALAREITSSGLSGDAAVVAIAREAGLQNLRATSRSRIESALEQACAARQVI